MASGTKTNEPATMAFWTLLVKSFVPMVPTTTAAATMAAAIRVPAYISHLICSRSTDSARRYRKISETREATPANRTRPNAPCMILSARPSGPPIPTGFKEWEPWSTPGPNAVPIAPAASAIPASHATGRHRLDGSAPVGNRSRTNVPGMAMPRPHTQLPSQSDHWVEKWPSMMENVPNASHRPDASSSQPIGFDGRFAATTAPTVANDRMKSSTVTKGASDPGVSPNPATRCPVKR